MKILLALIVAMLCFFSWIVGWNKGSDDGMEVGQHLAVSQIEASLKEELSGSKCFTLAPIKSIGFCPAGKDGDKLIVTISAASDQGIRGVWTH